MVPTLFGTYFKFHNGNTNEAMVMPIKRPDLDITTLESDTDTLEKAPVGLLYYLVQTEPDDLLAESIYQKFLNRFSMADFMHFQQSLPLQALPTHLLAARRFLNTLRTNGFKPEAVSYKDSVLTIDDGEFQHETCQHTSRQSLNSLKQSLEMHPQGLMYASDTFMNINDHNNGVVDVTVNRTKLPRSQDTVLWLSAQGQCAKAPQNELIGDLVTLAVSSLSRLFSIMFSRS